MSQSPCAAAPVVEFWFEFGSNYSYPSVMRIEAAAARRGVAVGAHVGYRDLAGFGRRTMEVAARDLQRRGDRVQRFCYTGLGGASGHEHDRRCSHRLSS